MKWAWLIFLCVAIPSQAATTFYVDSMQGSDRNPGTSPAVPWQSLDKINRTDFHPGDRILLKSGSQWQGQLAPKSSGAEGAPIVIDSYGGTALPHIDGMGKVEDAVRIYNVEEIEIRHLEITNQGNVPAVRRGVHIFLDNFGTARHIVLSSLYIHDVNGTNRVKDNGGIIFRTNGDKKPSRFDGLILEKNVIWKVDRSGIAADSFHAPRDHWFPSLHVVIRDNYVSDIGGDGIVPWATDGAIVEHNIALDCNRRAGNYNVAIWPWSTDNTVIRWNEAAFTHTTLDGEGFDSDYNSRNSVFEFNYSHDNDGGFILICSPADANPKTNIGNTGTVVHYNISRNDHARIVNLSGANQTLFEKNAIYIAPGDDVQLLVSNWNGWSRGAIFRDNTFYIEGKLDFGHSVSKHDDGRYEIAPGWGPAKDIVFERNKYLGTLVQSPPDRDGAVVKSAVLPKLNWQEPVFDPSHPETYDRFLLAHWAWLRKLFQEQFGSATLMNGSRSSGRSILP